MPIVEIAPGKLEWHDLPQWMKAKNKPCFNSMKLVMGVLSRCMKPGEAYTFNDLVWGINEQPLAVRLRPAFRGKNAKKLLDRLVRNGKITMIAEDAYALPDTTPKPRRT
jgi:hypothetical protein